MFPFVDGPDAFCLYGVRCPRIRFQAGKACRKIRYIRISGELKVLSAVLPVILLLPAALCGVGVVTLLITALCGVGIVTLLLPAALCGVGIITLLLPAALCGVGVVSLLITALLPVRVIVLSIALILTVSLGASSIAQRVVEGGVRYGRIGRYIKPGEAAGDCGEQIPGNKGQIQDKFIHFMSDHHCLAFSNALHNALIRILGEKVGRLRIPVGGDDAGDPEKQGPQADKESDHKAQAPGLQKHSGIGEQVADAGGLTVDDAERIPREAQLQKSDDKGSDDGDQKKWKGACRSPVLPRNRRPEGR